MTNNIVTSKHETMFFLRGLVSVILCLLEGSSMTVKLWLPEIQATACMVLACTMCRVLRTKLFRRGASRISSSYTICHSLLHLSRIKALLSVGGGGLEGPRDPK